MARIWFALVAVIAVVLAVLSLLSVLQHDQVNSHLLRQRLAVTVESTAAPFRSVVNLGLPVAMMRNKPDLLRRALATDPAITDVVLFYPSGIVIEATSAQTRENVGAEVRAAQAASPDGRWSLETDQSLISGASILNEGGKVVGGVLAVYPKTELSARSDLVARQIGGAAIALLLVLAGLAYLAVRWRLRRFVAGLTRLETDLVSLDQLQQPQDTPQPSKTATEERDPLAEVFGQLECSLNAASRKYLELRGQRAEAKTGSVPLQKAKTPLMVGIPETELTRRFARRLAPLVVLLTLGAALALGYVAYDSVTRSFGSEFAKRAQLIGSDASASIQRVAEAGVPLDSLVGGDEYFDHLLASFPEVSYFAVVTDRPLIEVGRQGATRHGQRASFPILVDGQTVGEIVTETDPDYFASQFRNVVLDLGVVLLICLLFAFELIVVMMTRSVTGPVSRLQYLANLQAQGDFSRFIIAKSRSTLDRLSVVLSKRTEEIGSSIAGLRFCCLSDVRLPLFFFAMADELPLSFFSLFSRAVDNPITWMNQGTVISLPLAAYLTAVLLTAPLARPAGRRFGYRRLFVAAALLTVVAKLGLFFADNILQVILLDGMNGIGFGFAAFACQDYVLDMLPKAARSRSMSLFRATMFSGIFAGTALGGILADRLGQRPVFLVCALLTVIAVLLICRLLPAGRPQHSRADDGSDADDTAISFNLLAPLRDPGFAAVALGIVIPLAIVDHVFISYLLSLQLDSLGASLSDIARVMMCFFLALVLAGFVQGRLPDGPIGQAMVLTGCAASAGFVLLIASASPSFWTALLAASGAGAVLGLTGGPQTALVMELAEGKLAHLGTSTVLGAVRVFERGGCIVGLLVIGWSTEFIGYHGAVGAIGAVTLAGALIFTLLYCLSVVARPRASALSGKDP